MKEKTAIFKLFKVMFSNRLIKYLFLIGSIMLLSGILFSLDYLPSKTIDYQPTKSTSSKSFEDQFIEIVDKTDKSIITFGEDYLAYLGEGMNVEDYTNATELFMEELLEINKPLEDLKPPEDRKILFNKYKTGYFLIMSVLEENVKLVTEENPDFDLSKDNQEKMSVGLNEIREVKEILLGKDKSI